MNRIFALFDKSAWLLILPAVVGLYFIDRAMLMTLLQWSLFAFVLAGIAIFVSRVSMPHLNIEDLMQKVEAGSMPHAVVSAALILFFGMLLLAMVIWGRA